VASPANAGRWSARSGLLPPTRPCRLPPPRPAWPPFDEADGSVIGHRPFACIPATSVRSEETIPPCLCVCLGIRTDNHSTDHSGRSSLPLPWATIYPHDRSAGMSPSSYLGAKVLVFVGLDVVLVTAFVLLTLLGRAGPTAALVIGEPTIELITALCLVAFASTAFGLAASALRRPGRPAGPILFGCLAVNLVLAGVLLPVSGMTPLAWLGWLTPARWGLAATVATSGLPFGSDPLWAHTARSWILAASVLAGQIVLAVIAARVSLRRLEPGRS
jgi:hypothetical protein